MSRHETRPNSLSPNGGNIERIIKNPALTKLSLQEGVDVCVAFWTKNLVPEEDITRKKGELLEEINNGISRKKARQMLSSFFRLRIELDKQNISNNS